MMKRMLSFMLITVLLMLMVPSVAEETVKTIELYANRIDLRQMLSQEGITVRMTETQLDGSGKLTLRFAYSASDELRAANNTIYVVPEILAAVGDADPVSLTKKNDRLQVFSEGAVAYYTVDNPDLQDVNLQISVAVQDYDKRAITEDVSTTVALHFLGDADKDLPVQEIHTGIPDSDGQSALPDSPALMSINDYTFGLNMLFFTEEGITYIPYEKGSLPEGYTLCFSDVKVNGVEWSAGLCSAYGELMYYLFPESKFPYPVESFTFSLIAYSLADGMPSYFSGPFEIIPDLAEVAQPEAQTAEENTEAWEEETDEYISVHPFVDDAGIHFTALKEDWMYGVDLNGDPVGIYGIFSEDPYWVYLPMYVTGGNQIDMFIGVTGIQESVPPLTIENLSVNGKTYEGDPSSLVEAEEDYGSYHLLISPEDFGIGSIEEIRTIEMDAIGIESIFRTGPVTIMFGK